MIQSIIVDNDTNTGLEIYQRDKINGFDNFVLDYIDSSELEEYAENNTCLIDPMDHDCPVDAISDYCDDELECEALNRGMIIFKPKSIIESQKI